MKIFKLLDIVLNLFEGEGGGAAAAGAGEGGAANAGVGDAKLPGSTRRGKSGEYSNVVFGKQDAQPGSDPKPPAAEEKPGSQTTVTSNTREERRAKYDEYIRGEGKEFYTEDTQKMINRRFKDQKAQEAQISSMQPIIDGLMQHYGITDGNLEKLQKAMDSDNAFFEAAAEEHGMTVEAYKEYAKMQRQNAALIRQQQERAGREQAEATYQHWLEEAEAMKADYPSFDLNAESGDKNFVRLLQAGVPMRTVYETIHLEEIKQAQAHAAAQAREKQIAESIRTNGRRPTESAASSQAAFTVKDDVSKLTRKDRLEIARRVKRGEQISF